MKKITGFTAILLIFCAYAQESSYNFIKNQTPSIQRCFIEEYKSEDDFNEFNTKISEGRSYSPYDDLLVASDELTKARYNKTLDEYKVKGYNFVVDVGQEYLGKIFSKTPLGPFYKKTIDFIQGEMTDEANAKIAKEFGKSIEASFAAYMDKLYKTNPNPSPQQIAAHKEKFVSSDLVNKDNYPIIGKEVDAFLLKYVQENEERFNQLIAHINEQHEQGVQERRDLNDRLINQEESHKNLVNSFKDLELQAEERYKSFLEFQEKAVEAINDAFKEIETLKGQVKSNSVKISENSKRIIELNKKVSKNEQEIAELKTLTSENRKLINENSYKIDVISGVLYNNVSVGDKITLLEKGLVKVNNPEQEISRLKKIETLEQFSRNISIANEGVQLAKNLGLSDVDAKNTSKILQLAGITAKGVTAYYTGDVLSGLQAVNALFEFGKEPQPDPEFQAIMEQFKVVNAKLDIINEKLDSLDSKINKLFDFELEMHKHTMHQLNIMEKKIDLIGSDIAYLIKILTSDCDILGEVNLNSYNTLMEKLRSARSYSDYKRNFTSSNSLKSILKCVYKNVSSSSISNTTFIHYNRVDQSDGDIQKIVFEPLLKLLRIIYKSKTDEVILALTNPLKFFDKINSFAYNYSPDKDMVSIDMEDVKILTDPGAINLLANLLILTEPYFVMGKEQSSFEPLDIEVLQSESTFDWELANSDAQRYFSNCLKFSDVGVFQQVLLSGAPLLSTFYNQLYSANSGNVYELSQEILGANNYFLHLNMSSYIVRNTLEENYYLYQVLDDIQNSLDSSIIPQEELSLLNSQFNYQSTQFRAQKQGDFYILVLDVVSVNNKDHKYTFPVADANSIFTGKIFYRPEMFDLLRTKIELESKIVEYDFASKIKDNEELKNFITNTLTNNIINEE